MTYKQAYDKIIDAYFKDEIRPFDCQFCFCGTLCGNDTWGSFYFSIEKHNYSKSEYLELEVALLKPLVPLGAKRYGYGRGAWGAKEDFNYCDPRYEDLLFKGMVDALNVLKTIHTKRGEVIDPLPTFTKRVFSDQIKVKTT